MSNMNSTKVTTVEDLIEYAKGAVVELPEFSDGMPFVARVRRPSMLVLMKSGKIPNTLMNTAQSLFEGKGIDKKDPDAMKSLLDVLDIFCNACLLEPTFKQIEEAGLSLTDEQMLAMFNYSQEGAKALEPFRKDAKNNKSASNGKKVQ